MAYCPQCGSSVEASMRFCPSCGSSLSPPSSREAPSQPESSPPTLERPASSTAASPASYALTVIRSSEGGGSRMSVFADGVQVATISRGGRAIVNLTPGFHTLSFKCGIKKSDRPMSIDRDTVLVVGFNYWGSILTG